CRNCRGLGLGVRDWGKELTSSVPSSPPPTPFLGSPKMAKGQHLSHYQQGIVKRYYENKDTLATQKLGEIVGELYLAMGDAKKSEKLWKSAKTALLNAK